MKKIEHQHKSNFKNRAKFKLTGLKSTALGFGLKTKVEAPGLSLGIVPAGETAADTSALLSPIEALLSSTLT
jgi:hypothetical protein